ncbi:hypothetical protein J23TS9_41750 [Paenibacillus sp. J23TS9]|uniref:hypothetical protein n=1 Tax=Paenibacillus sp. J23TS9 TaxID=2807193 RepID=UPI001B1C24B8|nr:hypothetical protein [Paenibacillus sp. J23TS9]GIP29045.1 hypothetical protein J23TS9_41750 [Paenibacillus sp. J23TS9]
MDLILLAAVMSVFVGLFSSAAASAEKIEEIDTSLLASKGALVQTKGSLVGQSVIDYFKANDVPVDNNSIIEILPLTQSGNSLTQDSPYHTVLSVTNVENGEVHKDVLVTYADEKDGSLSVVDVPVNSKGVQSGSGEVQPFAGTTIEFPPDSWDKRLTIRATAVYDTYSDGIYTYYSPWGAYFTYTKGTANNISFISVDYICDGAVYSNPGFKYQNRSASHSVKVSQSNPNASTMYSNTKYFESGKVLLLSGSPSAGNSITFEFTADGSSNNGYTVKF